jgi:FkbM family methyltransferase
MELLDKIIMKARVETRFLLEQKWGVKRPSDPFSIPKHSLKKYLPPDPVIIDCGAHVGADSVELARIFPHAVIHSFEPVPDIFRHLKSNTRKYPNIHCYQLALSDTTGSTTMFVSSGNSDASSSLLSPTGHKDFHPDVLFENTIPVQTMTLDDWATTYQVPRVDFLWLDMQGFESHMLQASSHIFPGVSVIHTEVSLQEAYAKAMLYGDFRNWMQTKGFSVAAEAIPEGVDMGNALFIKK